MVEEERTPCKRRSATLLWSTKGCRIQGAALGQETTATHPPAPACTTDHFQPAKTTVRHHGCHSARRIAVRRNKKINEIVRSVD